MTNQELIEAIRAGSADRVKALVSQGADVRGAKRRSDQPLVVSVESQHPQITRLLLEAGADPNAENHLGRPVATLAIVAGDEETVAALLEHGADPDRNSGYVGGSNLLDLAAALGQARICRLLIGAGARCDASNLFGLAPLHTAASQKRAAVVKALLEGGADVQLPVRAGEGLLGPRLAGWTALHFAVRAGCADAAAALIEGGADALACDVHGATPQSLASESANLRLIELLSVALPPAIRQQWLRNAELVQAVEQGEAERVVQLLAAGADPSRCRLMGEFVLGEAPVREPLLAAAVRAGRIDIAQSLLAAGADPDARIQGDASDPNEEEIDGYTPLMIAAASGNTALVQRLLDAGADTETPCRPQSSPRKASLAHDQTALYVAAEHGQLEIARQLIAAGAKVDAANVNEDDHRFVEWYEPGGRTPLMAAIECGSLPLVELLLDAGANLEHRDDFGQTPLLVALWTNAYSYSIPDPKEHWTVVERLIAAGADLQVRNHSGHGPLEFAPGGRFPESVERLIQLGAARSTSADPSS